MIITRSLQARQNIPFYFKYLKETSVIQRVIDGMFIAIIIVEWSLQ